MMAIPFYNMVIVPGANYYLQTGYFNNSAQESPVVNDQIVLVMLKEERQRMDIKSTDIFPIGVIGYVESIDHTGLISIKITGRVKLDSVIVSEGDIDVTYTELADQMDEDSVTSQKRFQDVKTALLRYVNQFQWGVVARNYIMQWKSLEDMAAGMSRHIDISNEDKYFILEADKLSARHNLIVKSIYETIATGNVTEDIKQAQQEDQEKLYREDAIKKQMQLLQKELDEMHPENVTDVRKFEKRIAESHMNDIARKEATKVLNRMKQEGENSHEYGMLYDYLDFVTSLSWEKEDFKEIDLEKAEEILDEDHYSLKKVKNRIIQQIAVMSLNKKQSGSILLFVGPPGTGKTSIGQSIAKALGRKYVRVSLGGIRDEAEIRGHRRTYVGAMPGRIMEGIKRSGASNPVVVLDEVDKLGRGIEGDPSSALLEVLDPEQNNTFTDHYMNVPYDLSDVLFICTANSVETIQEPLLNRMEVISFQGYTENEKMQIAKKHLLPKAMNAMGINKTNLRISDKAIHKVISDYTMESGVRGLKKQLDTLCRMAAVQIVRGGGSKVSVTENNLKKYIEQKPIRHDKVKTQKNPGIITGLAWTQAGGDILFIESMFTKGSGKTIVTGQLGDVMKESVQIAISLAKSICPEQAHKFEENDLHLHVPAGAVPKDGPSAGITLTTALVSLLTGKTVSSQVAMTGEVSLQGGVMPIGGLPEKLMAAVRAGVTMVFVPKDNEEDLDDIADEVKSKLEIIPVSKVTDVLKKLELI